MDTRDCVATIYNERSNFIIVGLTGRTGSGCSEAASILESANFEDLNLKVPKNQDYHSKDERKYKIIYDYAKSNWNQFYVLRMSDVIFSFLLPYKLEELNEIFTAIVPSWPKEIMEKVIKDSDFAELYNAAHESFMKLRTSDNTLLRDNEEQLSEEYALISTIRNLHSTFKQIASKYSCQTTVNIQKEEKEITANAYSCLWQNMGNIIRREGDVKTATSDSKNMFHLARRANDFIKAIRNRNKKLKQYTLICIDAFRNPYEAQYFQDRYSAFYLISINTEDSERRRRLGYLTNEQIMSLDTLEYPGKLDGINKFTNQNIAACIELSDIHIYNPHSSTIERFYLTEQLVKYIMLMKHPGLITPTHIERCMQMAYNAKLNSGCLSRQVGAVITDENFSVKAVGWNEVPEGQVPCSLRDIEDLYENKDYDTFSAFEVEDEKFNTEISKVYKKSKSVNLSGRCYQYCFKDIYTTVTNQKNQVHTRALHAEENAFLQLAKYGGIGIKGGNLFTTASPCELCSKKAYQLGIRNIYYIDPYPGISVRHILSFKNIHGSKPEMHLFVGAIGRAYTTLYSQKLSIKDELELLL
ncbi:MAG: hypothetical protein ACOX60_03290 [Massiliimalia sp.]|jgi:deoxycytidylate deaminase